MSNNIPTYQLNILSKQDEGALDIFMLSQKAEIPKASIDIPYRSNYYGLGICINGKAKLTANLESYDIEPGYMITMSPHVIKQWLYRSEDFETLTILFTKDFITANNNINLDNFKFFESVAKHAFKITALESEKITISLIFLQQKYNTQHAYRSEILKNLINILMYEAADIYNQQSVALHAVQTRSQLLSAEFKKLVNTYFSTQRTLQFYAKELFITPKHLTETLKEVTGKTAGQWIAETVVLEAKVLLKNPALSISQIADMLHFTDQSAFGKFFKNITGISPLGYKQTS